jgi:hypothetical protein
VPEVLAQFQQDVYVFSQPTHFVDGCEGRILYDQYHWTENSGVNVDIPPPTQTE